MLHAGECILHSRTFENIVCVTPKPARETRALARATNTRNYSPSRWRNCARAYSRLSFAIKLALILAGHTASHS